MAGAVQRLDVVAMNADLARLVVFWLGRYAELAAQRNGCVPEGLVEAQHALAEAAVGVGDSRQREYEASMAAGVLAFGEDTVMNAEAAAQMLRLKPDTVRLMCRKGSLAAKKVAGRWFPDVVAVEEMARERAD
ncbi:hypothetical protein A5621_00855 [Mycobacterium colombiense]|nr:hypothetical protein A5621_00855 [Mycobacterium colombiense]